MTMALPRIVSIWKFSRPHAFLGTAASIASLWLIAATSVTITVSSLLQLSASLLICLSAAVFIVGINQYYDVAIDRINKPHLPLASRELTRVQVVFILTVASGIAWIGMLFQDRYLIATVVLSSLLGIAYSCPPLRLKQSPYWAAAMIILVRGPIINLGLYSHFRYQLTGTVEIPAVVWLLFGLSTSIAFCIAVCKDIPDVEGDIGHGQLTFAQLLGQTKVFVGVLTWLIVTFCAAAVVFYMIFESYFRVVMIVFQMAIVMLVWIRGRAVEPRQRNSITPFYLLIWNIFQIEYMVIALIYYWQSSLGGVTGLMTD